LLECGGDQFLNLRLHLGSLVQLNKEGGKDNRNRPPQGSAAVRNRSLSGHTIVIPAF
jgi:hypothetical protein